MNASDTNHDLTLRAKLTFASQLLAHGAQMAAGLIFTPIIVHGLDKELYGAWGMIAGMMGFLGLADLNATSILRLVLGVRQHNPDVSEKRRLIGAAVWQWIIFLPLVLLAGTLLVLFAPRLVPVSPGNLAAVYWTMALMTFSIPLSQLCSIPGSVLTGQNLEYKAMGLNAAMVLLGGAMNALGVMAGFGLVMLAVTSLSGILLVNGARWFIARKHLPWFGLERPLKTEVREMIRLSIPGSLGSAKGALLNSADVLLFGYCFGTSAASVYMITGALIRYLTNPLQQLLRSGNPGIIFLGGKGEWERLDILRLELHQMAFLGFGVMAAIVLICNHIFVHLWVGERFYGGPTLDLAIFLHMFFRQMVQIDGIPIDASLHLYPKELIGISWSVIGLLFGWFLVGPTGQAGVPLGVAFGQAGLWVSYQYLLGKFTGLSVGLHCRQLLRPLIAIVLMTAVFIWFRLFHPLDISTWLGLGISGMLATLIASLLYGTFGLTSLIRQRIWLKLIRHRFSFKDVWLI